MDYSSRARTIRNKIKSFNSISVINLLLERLHTKPTGVDRAKHVPWLLCLMLEWTIELGIISNKKDATSKNVQKILNSIWDLQDQALDITNSQNAIFSMRKILIPQLRFQICQTTHISFLTRFSLIIRDNKYQQYFKNAFLKETHVPLDDFFKIALFLETLFKDQGMMSITYNHLVTYLHPSISSATINKTLRLLGANLDQSKDICIARRKQLNGLNSNEYFLEPALINKPILLLKDCISTPHSYIAMIGISEFVLRLFKRINHGEFKKRFTKLFETYISQLLTSFNIKFINENELEHLYDLNLPKNESTRFS